MTIHQSILFYLSIIFILFFASCEVTGSTDLTQGEYYETGIASWYGDNFHGGSTASGETYDMHDLTAAHKSLPFDTIVRVKNLRNGTEVTVRINDRGPFVEGRVIDLSRQAAERIGITTTGLTDVDLYILAEGDS